MAPMQVWISPTEAPRFVTTDAPRNVMAGFVLSSVIAVGCLSGAATMAVPIKSIPAAPETRTSSGHMEAATITRVVPSSSGVTAVLGDADELRWLKAHSGLTWDQLGKAFGVSRRAVHLWANGGRMNESNAAALRELAARVRGLGDVEPPDARAALLAVGPTGRSVIDDFRRRLAGRDSWAHAFEPEELVGALRDE